MKHLSAIFLLAFLSNCQSREPKLNSSINEIIAADNATVNLTCDIEQAANKSYPINKKSNEYEFFIEANCPKQSFQFRQSNLSKSLNIIFVLKFTKSMEKNLEMVSTNINALEKELRSNGWSVKFAGIGFSKYYHTFFVSNFLDSEDFVQNLKSWSTFETREDPVAGQMALSTAIDKFLFIRQKAPDRLETSRNVIFYISDIASYTEKSESDFSIDKLAAKIQASQIPNLELFYSTPDIQSASFGDSASALSQVQDLVKKGSISSTKLDFPLKDQSIERVAKQVVGIEEESGQICKLISLSFMGGEGQLASSNYELVDKNVFDTAKAKTPFIFKASGNPKFSNYWLRINRCCSKNDSQTCESTDTAKLIYKLKNLDS